MKKSIVFSKQALRQLVEEAFDNIVSCSDVLPVMQNPVVNLTVNADNASDAQFSELQSQIKIALSDVDELEGEKVKNVNKNNRQIETIVRHAVRRLISEKKARLHEMQPSNLSYSGPDTYAMSSFDEPWKVYALLASGRRKRQPDASFETEQEAKRYVDKQQKTGRGVKYEIIEEQPESSDDEQEPRGEWSVPKGELGFDFKDIARQLGVTQMGAQSIAARALKRYGFMHKMMFGDANEQGAEPERAQIMLLNAAKEFIQKLDDPKILSLLSGTDMQNLLPDSIVEYQDFLQQSGEISAADVQLMKDHPNIVAGLDGYPEFVRTELTSELKTELVDLPNDLNRLMSLDAFRTFLSTHIKRSMRSSGMNDED